MKVGVIGSGMVGQTIAAKLAALGHEVVIGTRDPSKLTEWLAANPNGQAASNAEAAAHGELIVNATNGAGSVEALTLAGADNLAGKVLLDISNPLDFSKGMPPTLFIKDDDSLGELIQRTFPSALVVKTLNTMNANVMVDPSLVADGDHTVFVSGNDTGAKAAVTSLLQSFGWRDILDLGDLSTARGTEMILPLWLRAWGALGDTPFQFKVARAQS